MRKVKTNITKNEENSTACKKNCFTSLANKVYAILALAKSKAERQNSNYLLVANSSTPLNRAFLFVAYAHLKKVRSNLTVFLIQMKERP